MLALIQPIYAYATMGVTALMVGVSLETAPMMNRPGGIAPAGANIMYDDTGLAADWLKNGVSIPKSEKGSTVPPTDKDRNENSTPDIGENEQERQRADRDWFRAEWFLIFPTL